MKSIQTTFFILLLSAFQAVFAESIQWLTSLDAALTQAKSQNRPVMLDIYAPWCGYCRKLRKEVYPSGDVVRESSRYVMVTVNGEQAPAMMEKYSIDGFPTILFLDKNGALMGRIDGFVSGAQLARKMRDVAGRGDTEERLKKAVLDNPGGILPNFQAGVYYYEAGDYRQAREYFLAASRSRETILPDKKLQSMYNAAVSSMDLNDHLSAVQQWTNYLNASTRHDGDYAYARYYRALSCRIIGNRAQAREDLVYAVSNLPDAETRSAAEKILATLR